jgi:hypothetical protein
MRSPVAQPADLEPFDLVAFNNMKLLDDEDEDGELEQVLTHTDEVCLHRAPVKGSSHTRKGYTAYAVFNGWNMGVFKTW